MIKSYEANSKFKQWINFVCEKGTFSQIQLHYYYYYYTRTGSHTTKYTRQCDNPLVRLCMRLGGVGTIKIFMTPNQLNIIITIVTDVTQ